MANLITTLLWVIITCTTSSAAQQQKRLTTPQSPVIETPVRQVDLQSLENEVHDLQNKLKFILSINQKVGFFNYAAIKNEVMAKDIQFIDQETKKRKEELNKQRIEFNILQSELESLRQKGSKSAVEDQIVKIQTLSTYLQNLEQKFDEEINMITKEVDQRFAAILSLSLRIFLEQNTSFILLIPNENFVLPTRITNWPLEIVDAQPEIMTLCLRNYYESKDPQN